MTRILTIERLREIEADVEAGTSAVDYFDELVVHAEATIPCGHYGCALGVGHDGPHRILTIAPGQIIHADTADDTDEATAPAAAEGESLSDEEIERMAAEIAGDLDKPRRWGFRVACPVGGECEWQADVHGYLTEEDAHAAGMAMIEAHPCLAAAAGAPA